MRKKILITLSVIIVIPILYYWGWKSYDAIFEKLYFPEHPPTFPVSRVDSIMTCDKTQAFLSAVFPKGIIEINTIDKRRQIEMYYYAVSATIKEDTASYIYWVTLTLKNKIINCGIRSKLCDPLTPWIPNPLDSAYRLCLKLSPFLDSPLLDVYDRQVHGDGVVIYFNTNCQPSMFNKSIFPKIRYVFNPIRSVFDHVKNDSYNKEFNDNCIDPYTGFFFSRDGKLSRIDSPGTLTRAYNLRFFNH